VKNLFAILSATALLAAALTGPAHAQGQNWGARDTFVPGEVLVKFKSGTSPAKVANAHARHAARLLRVLGKSDVHQIQTPLAVADAVRGYQSDPDVEYAEPNYIWRSTVIPNDTRFGELWGLHNTGQVILGGAGTPDADIDAPEAWNIQTGSSSIVVGVIDTGRQDHTDLVGNRWMNPGEFGGTVGVDDDGNGKIDDVYGWNFFGNNNVLFGSDACSDSHGTHTAGTVGAKGNNALGVVGVNWNVSIMSLKFLGGVGCSGSTANAVLAVQYAAAEGAKLTSNSWGGGGFSQALLDAINASGILFIAAAGNAGTNNDVSPFYPCNLATPLMICVASTTKTDAKSGFSNFGLTTVHLGAPGEQILSTVPVNGFAYFNGTSMATPHVAGVAALIAAQYPGISAADIKCRILQNVDPIPALAGITVTGGRLNAFKALNAPSGCATSTITGTILIDGVGQLGKTVKLKQGAVVVANTTTNGSGAYTFSSVNPGTYKVVIKGLSGAGTYSGNISVNAVGEAGKTVRISNGGGTTTTNGSGNFSKAGVLAGNHNVRIKNVDVP
jgi:subtilisin family serine protease